MNIIDPKRKVTRPPYCSCTPRTLLRYLLRRPVSCSSLPFTLCRRYIVAMRRYNSQHSVRSFMSLKSTSHHFIPNRFSGRRCTQFCWRLLWAWFSLWRIVSAAIPVVPRRSLVPTSLSGTRTLASQCQDCCAARPVSLASCVWLAAVPTVSPTTAVRRTSVSWHTSVYERKEVMAVPMLNVNLKNGCKIII